MSKVIDSIEQATMRSDAPNFEPGDAIRVFVKIREGDKERLQAFEGVVIARKHGGSRETFTVRKVSYGVGVERIFPLHSPRIDHIEIVTRGHVRRAKLYYLRDLSGKAARIRPSKKSLLGAMGHKSAAANASAAQASSETTEGGAGDEGSQA